MSCTSSRTGPSSRPSRSPPCRPPDRLPAPAYLHPPARTRLPAPVTGAMPGWPSARGRQRAVPDLAHDLAQLPDPLGSRSCGRKPDVDVCDLLGHAAQGVGEQREVGGADAALVVQVSQPTVGPVDEVGARAEPELAETFVPAYGGGLAHHPEQMAIARVGLE